MKISSLAALAELDRVNYAADVRTYWKGLEQELIEQQKEINTKLAGLLKTDPEAAARYATDSADSIARSALNKAGIIRNELLAFIASRGASETVRAPSPPPSLRRNNLPLPRKEPALLRRFFLIALRRSRRSCSWTGPGAPGVP